VSAGIETLLVGLFGALMLVGIRLSLYFMSREVHRPGRMPEPARPELPPVAHERARSQPERV
jgi:hypothetical protein